MSFRPTIAVRFGKEMADIGYYRNWTEESVLIEAAAIAAAYGDCRSAAEYRERAFGCQDISYRLDPELIPNTQENLRWLESCSELPVNVDLKARCIYVSEGALTKKALKKKRQPRLSRKGISSTDFYEVLDKGCFRLDSMDLANIRDMILESRDLQCRVSEPTIRALRKRAAGA